jgi:hypothetical protein
MIPCSREPLDNPCSRSQAVRPSLRCSLELHETDEASALRVRAARRPFEPEGGARNPRVLACTRAWTVDLGMAARTVPRGDRLRRGRPRRARSAPASARKFFAMLRRDSTEDQPTSVLRAAGRGQTTRGTAGLCDSTSDPERRAQHGYRVSLRENR